MTTDYTSQKPAFLAILLVAVTSLVASCSFQPGVLPITCKDFENIPLTPLSSQTSQTKFETIGTIVAIHGSGSAKVNSAKFPLAIKVEQSVPIPAYANRATVFLNGWKVTYSENDDQHVLALGTVIGKIRRSVDPQTRQGILTWNALGLLRDNDGEEGYEWSYNFTVVA
jgi:hypothetical protein